MDRHPDGTQVASPAHAIELDPSSTALVVVDVQRLFTDLLGVPVDPPVDEVLPRITSVLQNARDVGATVILVRSVMAPEDHSRNTLEWPDPMRAQMEPGAPGTEFDRSVDRQPDDIEVIKKRYSAFFGTSLDSILRERGIETVVVFGLTTNVCVQSTVRDAWQHGYLTLTVSDCCSEMGAGAHDMSMAWIARNFGKVCTSSQLAAAWTVRV